MTDITERLRRMATIQFAQYDHDAIKEAADQIEGLRDELRNAYRERNEASRDWEQAMRRVTELEAQAEQYSDTLRSLACTLGAGGYNSAGLIDPKSAEEKIRWGISHVLEVEAQRVPECIGQLIEDIRGLIEESEGVHLNGATVPWGELLPGGRFERLSTLDAAEAMYWPEPTAAPQLGAGPGANVLVEALEAIVLHYPNPNISHEDYRVHARKQADHALDAYRAALTATGGRDELDAAHWRAFINWWDAENVQLTERIDADNDRLFITVEELIERLAAAQPAQEKSE